MRKIFTFLSSAIGAVLILGFLLAGAALFFARAELAKYGVDILSVQFGALNDSELLLNSLELSYHKENTKLRVNAADVRLNYSSNERTLNKFSASSFSLRGELPAAASESSSEKSEAFDVLKYIDLVPEISLAKVQIDIKPYLPLSLSLELEKNPNAHHLAFGDISYGADKLLSRLELGRIQIAADRLSLSTDVRASYDSITAHGNIQYYPTRAMAEMNFKLPPTAYRALPKLKNRFIPPGLVIEGGSASASGKLTFSQTSALDVELALRIEQLSGSYRETLFQNLKTAVSFRAAPSFRLQKKAVIEVSEINPGLALSNFRGVIAERNIRGGRRVELTEVSLSVLGGKLFVPVVQLSGPSSFRDFPLVGSDLSLQAISALYGTEGLIVQGKLNFSAPLSFNPAGKLVCNGGTFFSRPEGGKISFGGGRLSESFDPSSPLRDVSQILDNFHYQELSGTFEYLADGTLQLTAKIKGSNPEYQRGRQVHLNLTLEDNIPKLLESLRVQEKIEQGFSRARR